MPLGNHVSKDGESAQDAFDMVVGSGARNGVNLTCSQIFLIGPQSTKETLSAEEKAQLSTRIGAGARMYAHASYLSNPWGAKAAFGASLVRKELKLCAELGLRGLVIHLARKPPAEIAAAVPQLIAETSNGASPPILFLEIESYKPLVKDQNSPASATIECTYETPQKLSELTAALVAAGVDMRRVGICIDTAHLWAAGVDISTYEAMNSWLKKFHELCAELPRTNLLVHLNDQIWPLGGGKDEHAPLLLGTMWGKFNPETGTDTPENSGLQCILEWATGSNIDLIMERKAVKPLFKDPNGGPINNMVSDYKYIRGMGFFVKQ